jgi:hypothetical protein
MIGDTRPDLVVTYDCYSVGETYWHVYENIGTGFAAVASPFTVPGASYPWDPSFPTWDRDGLCSPIIPTYRTVDVTGDGRPDLVITYDCAGAVGESSWIVHVHDGSGFRATAETWGLPGPSHGGTFSFATTASYVSCSGQYLQYSLLDLGTGPATLVVTDNCDSSGVGTTHWLAYDATLCGPI